MEYVLKTEALTKHYKNFKALNGLNMQIPKEIGRASCRERVSDVV